MFNTNTSNNLIFIIKSHLIIQSFCLHPVRKIRIFCLYCTSGGRDFRREASGIPRPADKGCPGNSLSLKTAVFKDNHRLKLYLVLENGCFQGQSTKESVDFLDFKRIRMVAFECLRVQCRRSQARHSYAGRANQ